VAKPFSPAENERLREVADDLCEERGLDQLAKELAILPAALRAFLAGSQPAKPQWARDLARLKGVSLDELLAEAAASPAADPLPNRTEAIAIARREGYAAEAIADIESAKVERDKSLIDWLYALREAHQRRTAPPSTAIDAPTSAKPALAEPPRIDIATTPTAREVSPPSTSIDDVPTKTPSPNTTVAPPQPTLTLLEFASVSMGLEVLPHRRSDVFRKFGLDTEAAQESELAAWQRYFEENAGEKREWEKMRARMRNHWIEFDRGPAAPPIEPIAPPTPTLSPQVPPVKTLATGTPPLPPPTTLEPWAPPAAPPPASDGGNETALFVGSIVFPEADAAPRTKLDPPSAVVTAPMPSISLRAYAEIGVDLQLMPGQADSIFARHGLHDPAQRTAVDAQWKARLGSSATERAEWEHLCAERRRFHEAQIASASTARLPAGETSRSAAVPAAPMDLAEYALMCVELEKKPMERESIYERHGLIDPKKRRAVDEAFRARFDANPAERAQWQSTVERIRNDWMDL